MIKLRIGLGFILVFGICFISYLIYKVKSK